MRICCPLPFNLVSFFGLVGKTREQFVDALLVCLEHLVQVVLKGLLLLVHICCDRLVIQVGVKGRVICVHVDLSLVKCDTCIWLLLVEYDIKGNPVVQTGRVRENLVLLHLAPRGPKQWLIVHRFVQEVERSQADGNVCRPAPRSSLDLIVQVPHGVLAFRV